MVFRLLRGLQLPQRTHSATALILTFSEGCRQFKSLSKAFQFIFRYLDRYYVEHQQLPTLEASYRSIFARQVILPHCSLLKSKSGELIPIIKTDRQVAFTLRDFLELLQEIHPDSVSEISDGLLKVFRLECNQSRDIYLRDPSLLNTHRQWIDVLPESEKATFLKAMEEAFPSL